MTDKPDPEAQLNRACARVFGSADGKLVLDWLEGSFIKTIMGPDATDAAIRYREGGRFVVACIAERIELGKTGHGRRNTTDRNPARRHAAGAAAERIGKRAAGGNPGRAVD